MNMEEEIKKLQNKTEELETHIEHLRLEVSDREDEIHVLNTTIDELFANAEKVGEVRGHIRDIMEEVAKLAKEPVGMMFDYSRV
jgi:SMC interacting uncharacterized protein involved in chromosome segregation